MSFVPCAECRRHVQALATACPFCGAARTPGEPAHRAVPGRLRRSALVALGASAILTGCGGDDGGNVVAMYGAPSDGAVDTGKADTGTTPEDTGTKDSSTTDTGSSDTGSDVGDAGADTRETGVAPPYGIPPSDGG